MCVCSSFVCESLCWCMRCVCLRACACVPLFVVWSEHKTGIHTSHNGVRGKQKTRRPPHTAAHDNHPPPTITGHTKHSRALRLPPRSKKIKGVRNFGKGREAANEHTRVVLRCTGWRLPIVLCVSQSMIFQASRFSASGRRVPLEPRRSEACRSCQPMHVLSFGEGRS